MAFPRFPRFPHFPLMRGSSLDRLKRLLGIAEIAVQRDADNNVAGKPEPEPGDSDSPGSTNKDV